MHWSHAGGIKQTNKQAANRLERFIYDSTTEFVPFFSNNLSCTLTIYQIMAGKHSDGEGCSIFSMIGLSVAALWEMNSTRLQYKIL